MYTKQFLTQQLISMGLCRNDTVLIHTSMKAIGDVENGADGVIDVFKEYLSDGLFIVPTHTWDNVTPASPIYDVRTTVPCIGALPRAAAFRPDGIRSLHPTHSVWATGKGAVEFTQGEQNATTPAPEGFLWDNLASKKAKILLIGVKNDKNTFIHSIDEVAHLPNRLSPTPFNVTIIDHGGAQITHPFFHHFCSKSTDVSRNFVNFEKPLIALGAQKSAKFGDADVLVVDAQKCKEIILRIYSRAKEDLCIEKRELPDSLYL